MKMKKLLAGLLIATMAFGVVGCGAKQDNNTTQGQQEQVAGTTESEINDDMGKAMISQFKELMAEDANTSTDAIGNALCENPVFEMAMDAGAVEPGLLTGFGNEEIKGFKEGTMFSPIIGSIPFVGYIFRIDDETNVSDFINELKENANLRWNICTEADQMLVTNVDKTVLFAMYSTSEE